MEDPTGWSLTESDPQVFTQLLRDLGVKGLQVVSFPPSVSRRKAADSVGRPILPGCIFAQYDEADPCSDIPLQIRRTG